MRLARPAFTALSAQVGRAAIVAAAFTLAAAVLALALPVVVLHAIEAAERRQSLEAFACVAAVGCVAALLRAALLAARDRMLLQAALWFDHTAGSAVLTDRLERGVMPDALEADRAALDRCVTAISGPAVASLLDAMAAIVPLAVLSAIHPALGAVSLLCVAGLIGSALVRARAAAAASGTVASTHAAADKAWRTAAANGPMIAARRMAAGIVADWATLHRTAIVGSYGLARPARRTAAVLRAVDVGSCVVTAIAGVWLVLAESLTIGGLAAGVVLHMTVTRAVLLAHDRVPELAGLESGLQHLAASPVAMADRAAPHAPEARRSAPAIVAAPASIDQPGAQIDMGMAGGMAGASQATQMHPARPTFRSAAPLPTARPPAAYGTVGRQHGGT